MPDKNDELVLVIKKDCIKDLNLPGELSINLNRDIHAKFCSAVNGAVFRRRGDVETDPTYLQIISYCVILDYKKSDGKFLIYNRGSKGGEERLANKWSIGVGGHINSEDVKQNIRGFDLINSAAKRELSEELVGLDWDKVKSCLPQGIFYRDDTPVNEVHLGVCYLVVGEFSSVKYMGDGIVEHKWVTLESLNKDYDLEAWSAIVRDAFLPEI